MGKQPKDQSNFFADVYEVVKLIPSGRVSSYGAIARYLGLSRGARMVGWAMMSSHYSTEQVPAHRVVNRQGLLTGRRHYPTPTQMQERLEAEGIPVKDEQVQNFDHYFWDPSRELL